VPAAGVGYGTPVTREDEDHLRLLSIFHYVVAALVGLCSLIPLVHLTIGALIVSGKAGGFPSSDPGEQVFGEAVGWFFILVAGALILGGLTVAGCLFHAAGCLRERRSRTFCIVTAAFACLWAPFGTVLGVFTLLVLMRDGVREAFLANDRRG
jgi:hypothetical protein